MKICIFSDIHGNGPAFRAAFSRIISESADINIYLGDLCGYYFDQLEIYPLLRKIPNLVALRGNHDQIFLDIVRGNLDLLEEYRIKYGKSMNHLLSGDYGEFIEWLPHLSASYCDASNGFSCYHGCPSNALEGYVYPDSSLESIGEFPGLFCLFGSYPL